MEQKDLVPQMVENGQLNRYLYKYLSMSDSSKKNTLKDITNRELWFSSPSAFNDPFDCAINPTVSSVNRFARQIAERQPYYNPIDVENAARHDPGFKEIAIKATRCIAERQGICCFSKVKDNILMWSHYADNHRGICLEFDLLEDSKFFYYPIDVKYKKQYPVVDYSKFDFKKEVMKIFQTKYSDWEYEKEVRICKPNGGNNCFSFKPLALRNIYFGCNADKETIGIIRELIANDLSYNHIRFYQGIVNDSEYKIDFIPIMIDDDNEQLL